MTIELLIDVVIVIHKDRAPRRMTHVIHIGNIDMYCSRTLLVYIT